MHKEPRNRVRALTRFMTRTGFQSNEYNLFWDEQSSQLFPLIPVDVRQFTYLSTLLPRNRIFEDGHNEPGTKDDEKQKENECRSWTTKREQDCLQ